MMDSGIIRARLVVGSTCSKVVPLAVRLPRGTITMISMLMIVRLAARSASSRTSLFSTNNYFTHFGQTRVAMATVLEGALATGLSASTAFQAVANTGYAGTDSRPGYGTKVDTRIGQVDTLIDCMQLNGMI